MKYLYYTLRDICRGICLQHPPRQPITTQHLWLSHVFVMASSFLEWDKAMWRCATLKAFLAYYECQNSLALRESSIPAFILPSAMSTPTMTLLCFILK